MSPAIYRTSLSNPSHTYSARNSREHLIPKSPRPRSVRANHVRSSRAPVGKGGAAIEQKRSHGIGGAGNIRRPSEVIYPLKLDSDGTRKRGIVWSGMSTVAGSRPLGKHSMISGLFGRTGDLGSSMQSNESRGATLKRAGSAGKKSSSSPGI